MNQLSPKLARARRLYMKMRNKFLHNRRCPVFGGRATEVHHTRGRIGTLLIDVRWWIGVSVQGHKWIHKNPNRSREKGWLARPGQWNTIPRDEETERLKDLLR